MQLAALLVALPVVAPRSVRWPTESLVTQLISNAHPYTVENLRTCNSLGTTMYPGE